MIILFKGSPFISKSTDGEWYIVGIVSWDVGFGKYKKLFNFYNFKAILLRKK